MLPHPLACEEVQLPALGLESRGFERAAERGCGVVHVHARAEVRVSGIGIAPSGLHLACAELCFADRAMLLAMRGSTRQLQDCEHGLQAVALVQHAVVLENVHVGSGHI